MRYHSTQKGIIRYNTVQHDTIRLNSMWHDNMSHGMIYRLGVKHSEKAKRGGCQGVHLQLAWDARHQIMLLMRDGGSELSRVPPAGPILVCSTAAINVVIEAKKMDHFIRVECKATRIFRHLYSYDNCCPRKTQGCPPSSPKFCSKHEHRASQGPWSETKGRTSDRRRRSRTPWSILVA